MKLHRWKHRPGRQVARLKEQLAEEKQRRRDAEEEVERLREELAAEVAPANPKCAECGVACLETLSSPEDWFCDYCGAHRGPHGEVLI